MFYILDVFGSKCLVLNHNMRWGCGLPLGVLLAKFWGVVRWELELFVLCALVIEGELRKRKMKRERLLKGKGDYVRSCVSDVGAQKQFVEDSLWFLDFYEVIFLKLWVVVCTWHQNAFQGEFFLVLFCINWHHHVRNQALITMLYNGH